ncbi:MAG: hypothetical protein CSA82_02675 [Actinobacteria bacterium]|nr:MAG: hypothetical protein CSA82_02675 [Actinomycetota bacterium]
MGRGRQKAKQTKVARKLKYFSPETDLEALQRELASGHDDSEDDLYTKYADVDSDDDDSDDEDYWLSLSKR